MAYLNGKDVFPEQLLRQIQRYVSGKLVYIPACDERRGWGETSGYKRYLRERNAEICREFAEGADIEALAEKYGLSWESVRKIVYTKKGEEFMEYRCALSSAEQFARAGKLEQWVHSYLLSDGNNREFSDGLKLFDRYYLGPVVMPLKLFHRCCGPEENMTFRVDGEWFEKHVTELLEALRTQPDMPPLIAHYVDGDFELNDGNHRFEALNRMGVERYPFIIWITEDTERAEFMEKYGEYLK